jgi:hypothetical protein
MSAARRGAALQAAANLGAELRWKGLLHRGLLLSVGRQGKRQPDCDGENTAHFLILNPGAIAAQHGLPRRAARAP